MLKNKNIKIILNYVLGPLVFIFLSYSISRQILQQPDWKSSLRQVIEAAWDKRRWLLIATCVLMLVNWGLESRKWQIVLRDLQPVSFLTAFKAVLTGITIGSFTPNRMGEYVGRMLFLDETKRSRSIALTMICSLSQLLVTLVAGSLGVILLESWIKRGHTTEQRALLWIMPPLLMLTIITSLILGVIYFRISHIVKYPGFRRLHRFAFIVKVLQELDTTTLFRILCLSFGRYLIFILQYYLLFMAFGVQLTAGQTFASTSVMFLIMAVIPSLTFLTDLGLRWEASIRIVQLFSPNTAGIFAVSLGIWLINLIIPALIGSLLILRIKLFRIR